MPAVGLGEAEGRSASTDSERALARVFREVLHLEHDPSLDEDFFRLGGHSLLATHLVALANARLGIELSLRDVFDRPTVAGLAQLATSSGPAEGLQVGDLERPDVLAVSFGQQSMWLVDQLGESASRYVVPLRLRLSGDLNEAALIVALQDVVGRHEALRTLLVEQDGQLQQVIVPAEEVASRLDVAVVNLTGSSADLLDARIAEMVRSHFDLGVELPLRAGLFRVAADERDFVVVLHHHAVDEWSLPSLLGDLAVAYRARVAGTAVGWAPLRVQYADYAVWQRAVLGDAADPGSRLSLGLDYWRAALEGAPAESSIDAVRTVSAVESDLGVAGSGASAPGKSVGGIAGSDAAADLEFSLDADVLRRLRELASARGVTGFMVFQTAVALTVSALGGGDDVVIGSPVGGRAAHGLEDLVGYFVNPLPFRHQLRADDLVQDVLDRARETVLAGLAHQAVPFEQIAAAVGAQRSLGRNPVFQVMLTYRHLAAPLEPELPGVQARLERVPLGAVKTDLDLYVTEHADQATGFLSYATHLFSPATAERFVRVLTETLRVMSAAPETALADLDVGGSRSDGDPSTRSLLEPPDPASADGDELVDQSFDHRGQGLLDELIWDGVEPRSLAVVSGEIRWTFAELDDQVEAFAKLLTEHAVTVGDRVAVLLPRSVERVVALLGVLRAGAVCVPVDPGHPQERVQHFVEDSGAVLLVGADQTFTRLAADRAAVPRGLSPDDAAFVIFTSGTTGRPKGVVLSHRAVANRLLWGADVLGLGPGDRALAKSSVGFVDAATELLGPLAAGTAVVIAGEAAAGDPVALARAVREHGVTHLLTVPSLADVLAQVPNVAESLGSLRQWVCSGEVLAPATMAAVRRVAPSARLHNFYGSTEVTGDATVGDEGIGRPVPGMRALVLDAWLRPVAPGVVGELYVGGVQVAQGYAGKGALSAERFVADPFSGRGERLYRTGDLARWTELGELETAGRVDDQVKIRGFRVEPEEVRACLQRHPAVTGAVVVAREQPAGGLALAAYVTRARGGEPRGAGTLGKEVLGAEDHGAVEAGLRAHAAAVLPDYLVPASFTVLNEFPLTPNGKLDRGALPAPELSTPAEGGRAAQSEHERVLAEAFREVLRLERVPTVQDDFFRLGGDSISAARLVSTVLAQELPLTLREVFEHRTVGALAQVMPENTPTMDEPVPVAVSAALERLRESGADPNAWVYTERFESSLPVEEIAEAFTQLVRRTDALRLNLQPVSKRLWLTEVLPAVKPVVVAAELDGLRKAAAQQVDITQGRPAALAYAPQAEGGTDVVLAVHAGAADRASVHRLAQMLVATIGLTSVDRISIVGPASSVPNPQEATASLAQALQEVEAAGSQADTTELEQWQELLKQAEQPDESLFDEISREAFPAPVRDDLDVREALRKALHTAGYRGLVDEEVALRPDSSGPFTATAPVPTDASGHPSVAGFPLLRHHNQKGRRALRRTPVPPVLLTRIHAEAEEREGVELLYRAVVRYRIEPGAVTVTVLGLAPDVIAAVRTALTGETRTSH
nr:non-ribosomal peptide synthetase [Kineosporia babensis]